MDQPSRSIFSLVCLVCLGPFLCWPTPPFLCNISINARVLLFWALCVGGGKKKNREALVSRYTKRAARLLGSKSSTESRAPGKGRKLFFLLHSPLLDYRSPAAAGAAAMPAARIGSSAP